MLSAYLGELRIRPLMVKYNAIFMVIAVLSIFACTKQESNQVYRHYTRGGICHGRGKTIAKIHGQPSGENVARTADRYDGYSGRFFLYRKRYL